VCNEVTALLLRFTVASWEVRHGAARDQGTAVSVFNRKEDAVARNNYRFEKRRKELAKKKKKEEKRLRKLAKKSPQPDENAEPSPEESEDA